MDPDRRNLPFSLRSVRQRPDPRPALDALRRHAELPAHPDQHLFQQTDEVHWAQMRTALAGQVAAQIDDGIPHQLSGPVVGDIAAAVDFMQLDALRPQQLVGGEHMFAL